MNRKLLKGIGSIVCLLERNFVEVGDSLESLDLLPLKPVSTLTRLFRSDQGENRHEDRSQGNEYTIGRGEF